MKKPDKPYLFVDFNEAIIPFELYLLSKMGMELDIDGNPVTLSEGLEIFVWDLDCDDNGEECILVADGIAELNTTQDGEWCSAKKVKWCCRIDRNSFRNEKKDSSKFFKKLK